MIADALLQRLEGVKGRNGRWTARCPAHADKSPSLAITETADGVVLVKCFAGCEVESIVTAVGLDLTDLFPPKDTTHQDSPARKPLKPRFFASDLLRVIAFEATVVMVAGHSLAQGEKLTKKDLERLGTAVGRINEALDAANGQ